MEEAWAVFSKSNGNPTCPDSSEHLGNLYHLIVRSVVWLFLLASTQNKVVKEALEFSKINKTPITPNGTQTPTTPLIK
jgi:hypothetical protein